MKLTLESKDTTYTIDIERDDLVIGEMVDVLKGLLVQIGYHPISVEQAFDGDSESFSSWELQKQNKQTQS